MNTEHLSSDNYQEKQKNLENIYHPTDHKFHTTALRSNPRLRCGKHWPPDLWYVQVKQSARIDTCESQTLLNMLISSV
jgi:hypothetical protein